MAGLAEPNPPTLAPGTTVTGAFWNANVRDALNYLLNPPIFSAYLNATGTLTSGTNTLINLDTVEVDSYGGWSTSSFAYTIPVGGWWDLKGGCGFAANATGQRLVWINVNGSLDAKAYVSVNAAAAGSTNIGIKAYSRYFNQGDQITLLAQQNSGSSVTTTLQPFMQARWVHQ